MNFSHLKQFVTMLTICMSPGSEIAVAKDGETVFELTVGNADKEAKIPLEQNQPFYLYSSTKVITCTAVLQLYEKGLLNLEDPVSKFLPEYSDMMVKGRDGSLRKAEKAITVKHLLTMTAGFNYNFAIPEIQKVQSDTQGRAPTREVIRALAAAPLDFEPGSHFQYSLCHDVLGALIEVVSGMKFSQYVQENIFNPLGMENSTFHRSEELLAKMPPMYVYNEKARKPEKTEFKNDFILGTGYESGGAGIISTVSDYLKFENALCAGETLLKRSTIDLMHTDMLTPLQKKEFPNWNGPGYSYGLGVRVMVDPKAAKTKAYAGEFGWAGAAGAYGMIDIEHGITVSFAQHMLSGPQDYIESRLRGFTYDGFEL